MAIESQINDLEKHMTRINKRIDEIRDPSSELSALQTRVSELAEATENSSSGNDTRPLADRVESLDTSLKSLRNEVLSLQTTTSKPPSQGAATGPETIRRVAARPSLEDVNVDGEAFGQGVELFQKSRYDDALNLFSRMEQTHPNDARVWYFAALSNGLATGKWDGKTAELVQKGIERRRPAPPRPARSTPPSAT